MAKTSKKIGQTKSQPAGQRSRGEPSSIEENYDLQIFQSIRRIIRAVDIHSRRLFVSTKLTSPQLLSLVMIRENEPLTSAELGKLVYLSPSTIVGILDRLEDKRLVVKTRDHADRRKVFISMTEKGREVLQSAPLLLQDRLAKGLSAIPDLERATIALSFERVVELMEAEEIDAAPILETGSLVDDNKGTTADGSAWSDIQVAQENRS